MPTLSHVCPVIPEPMLRHAAEHGDAADREVIERTLAHSGQLLQGRRSAEWNPSQPASFSAFLDAQLSPGKLPKKHRYVYNAHYGVLLPGELALTETSGLSSSTDPAAQDAWRDAGTTFDYYATIHHLNSIDGRGMPFRSTVHYGRQYVNAVWNGELLIYGDGDGKLFNPFTGFLDVTGHEMTHGVIQHSAALDYMNETGALNESIADVFGELVEQWKLGLDARKADWLIGKGLFGKSVNGKALRSMAAPGTAFDDPILGRDPQPAHMRDYVHTHDDRGGVHINSGIPNHAFYLVATAMGGPAWDGAGRIWYATLTERLARHAVFQDMSNETYAETAKQYGAGSPEHRIVGDAWSAVGVPPSRRSSFLR